MRRFPLIVSMLLIITCTSTMTPRANTREEVVAYVDRAAQVVAENGPSCDTFQQPRWLAGDYYVFVISADGVTTCHPVRPDLVGTNANAVVDANGKRIGEEFIRVANGPQGNGWVDYEWARPGQSVPVAKSSYVRRVIGPDGKSYIVGSGGYELR